MISKRVTPPNYLGLGPVFSEDAHCNALIQIVEPHGPQAKPGRRLFLIVTTLRIHYSQQRFGSSDPATKVRCAMSRSTRVLAGQGDGVTRLPDETIFLRFRQPLEPHRRDPEMHQVKRGN